MTILRRGVCHSVNSALVCGRLLIIPNVFCCWAKFNSCKLPNIEKQLSHPVTLVRFELVRLLRMVAASPIYPFKQELVKAGEDVTMKLSNLIGCFKSCDYL